MDDLTQKNKQLHIVLVEPEIHWNTGNIGRTCLGAKAQLHLVGPLGFSLDAREVKRAGLDYWAEVRPRVWKNWDAIEPQLPALGETFFLSPDGEKDIWTANYGACPVLVFGKESAGLPNAIRKRYRERCFRIPSEDKIRSLNLSTAVGIVAYEALRQQRLLQKDQEGEAAAGSNRT